MYEVTCDSSAQAKKDKYLLATYRITPQRVFVNEKLATYHLEPGILSDRNKFLLEIKEAFIQRRFQMNLSTGESKLIDPKMTEPKLVIVASENSQVGLGTVDWVMEIVDKKVVDDERTRVVASHPAEHVFDFNLKSVDTFIPQEFQIRLTVTDEHGTKRLYMLTAKPIASKSNTALLSSNN